MTKYKKDVITIFKKRSKEVFLVNTIKNELVTYEEFFKKTLGLISYFKSLNLTQGNKILINRKNSEEYLIVFLAACLGGFSILPVDPEISNERLEVIKKTIKFDLIIDQNFRFKFDTKKYKEMNLIDLQNHDFLLISSSGTQSDIFKALLFDSNTFLKSASSFSKLTKHSKKNVLLHCLPMFYMAGILNTFFSPIFSQNKIILAERFSVFNLGNISKIVKENKVNSFHITPDIYRLMYKMIGNNEMKKIFKNVSHLISTGSILHNEIKQIYLNKFKKKIFSCYGLTELGGPLTIENNNTFKTKNCVGIHDDLLKIKVNKNRVLINSPFKSKGYLSNAGLEKLKLVKKFYDTGDLGFYKNKKLFINGRAKDIIKKGGEIVSLSFIEDIFLSRDDILEVAAVPLNYDITKEIEENYVIFITMNEKYEIENKIVDFTKFYRSKLRKIEYPKKILIIDKMPKTSIGKIKKRKLIELFTL